MKKSVLRILLSVSALVFISSFCVTNSTANGFIKPLEFGDFAGDSDYDFGGGYDSGFDSGSDYDYDSDSDSDYNYGSYSSGTTGSVPDDGSFYLIFGLAVIIAVVVALRGRKKGKNSPKSAPVVRENVITADPNLLPIEQYKTIDPNFSDIEFMEKASNLYVRFQNSWQKKDLSDVRPYLSDAMFAQVDRQLDNYRKNKKTNRVEDIAVLSVKLLGYKQEQGTDIISAELRTRIKDYVVDDATGDVVRGNPQQEKFMCYRWTFARTTGFKTAENSGFEAKSCPHCGAPIDINQSAVCEYCGSVLTSDSFDWVVNNIEAISQKTV